MQLIEAEDLFWDFGKAPPKTQRQVEKDSRDWLSADGRLFGLDRRQQ